MHVCVGDASLIAKMEVPFVRRDFLIIITLTFKTKLCVKASEWYTSGVIFLLCLSDMSSQCQHNLMVTT